MACQEFTRQYGPRCHDRAILLQSDLIWSKPCLDCISQMLHNRREGLKYRLRWIQWDLVDFYTMETNFAQAMKDFCMNDKIIKYLNRRNQMVSIVRCILKPEGFTHESIKTIFRLFQYKTIKEYHLRVS